MSIIETPVVKYLNFEVWDTGTGAWRNLATKATTVTIQRGGKRNTGANKIDVGTLDATLFGPVDLITETALKPNSPIRVVQPVSRVIPMWASAPRNDSSSIFAGLTPAAVAAYASGTGHLASDFAGGVVTGTGTTVVFSTKPTINVVLPANISNANAQYLFGPDVGMTPGQSYAVDVSATDYDSNPANPNVPRPATVIVAYAYDPATGSAVGSPLATSQPRTFSTTVRAFPTIHFTAPAAGQQVLLTVQVAAPVTITSAAWAGVSSLSILSMSFEPVKVGRYHATTPRFTGAISDVAQTVDFDKSSGTKRVYTSLFAVDAVQPLANTQRYGAVSFSGLGYQPWSERIQQLATSAPVPVSPPPASERSIYAWPGTDKGSFSGPDLVNAGVSSYLTTYVAGDTPAIQARQTRDAGNSTANIVFRPAIYFNGGVFTTAGRYRVDFDLTLAAATGINLGTFAVQYSKQKSDPITLPAVGTTSHYSWEFNVNDLNSGPHLVSLTPSSTTAGAGTRDFTLQMSGYTVRAIGDPKGYQLADVAFESDLASHFDLACNSVGARWWVDVDGVVQFSRTFTDPAPVLSFSDVHDGSLGYVDLGLAFDTRNVVNSLTLAQHGRVPDTAAESAGNANDYNVTFTGPGSIRRWGQRAGTIDTCLYTGPGFENTPSVRAREVIDSIGTPSYVITSLQWNAQQDPKQMALLDIYTPVAATYGALTQVARVIGIKETITPTRWLVDLDLTDIKAGATFADLADAWSGLTFAEVNERLGTKTFTQFNGDPLS